MTSPAANDRRVRWMVLLAAAAILVAVVVVPRLLRRDGGRSEPRFSGAGIHALSPSGAVQGDLVFSWSSAIAAPRYKIEAGNANGIVYSTDSLQSPLTPPPLVQQRVFPPGGEYWWTVTALDASGRALQTSPRQAFSVALPR